MSSNYLSPTQVVQQLKNKRPRELNTKILPLWVRKLTLEYAAGVCEPGGLGARLTPNQVLVACATTSLRQPSSSWGSAWSEKSLGGVKKNTFFLQASKAQWKEERERGRTTQALFLLKRSQPFSARRSERRRWGKRPRVSFWRGSLHTQTWSQRSELYPKHLSPSLDSKSLEHKITFYFSYHLQSWPQWMTIEFTCFLSCNH